MFADARSNDIVVDASDVSSRPTPRAIDALYVSSHAANVDWCRSLQQSSLDLRPGHDHLQDRTGARGSTGRDPPQASTLRWPGGIRQVSFLRAHSATATKRRARSFAASATGFAMGNSGIALPAQFKLSTSTEGRTLHSAANGCLRRDSHGDRNIGEAQSKIAHAVGVGEVSSTRYPLLRPGPIAI